MKSFSFFRFDWQKLWQLVYPYFFQSSEKLTAWLLLSIGNLLLLLASALGPIIIEQLGQMLSALAKGDQPRFYHAVSNFAQYSLVSSIAIGIGYYSLNLLMVRWRGWLSKQIIGQYLKDRAYYQIKNLPAIDNPDARIAQEIETFLSGLLGLNTLIPIFSGRSFVAASYLWGFSPQLTVLLILLGSLSTWFSYRFFFRAMLKIKYAQNRREGNFRTGLVKIRENSESIAFYQGEAQEKNYIEELFERVFQNRNQLIRWQNIYLGSFTGLNDILVSLLAYSFAGWKILSSGAEIGTLTTVVFNSSVLYLLFSIFGQIIDELSDTFNALFRLNELQQAIEDSGNSSENRICIEYSQAQIQIENLSLTTPKGEKNLFENFNINVNQGERLLLRGKSGAGKSSLLRALAGLWSSGQGKIIRPQDIFFIPQRPYMGFGTLSSQLLYPQVDRGQISQEELKSALSAVNLADLPERFGGFAQELDWDKVLSIGEQQRLAFARILLKQAKFIVLDEATSALDIENTRMIYRAIANKDRTIITVGHNSSLVEWHDKFAQIPPEQ
jgi:vitamin B12/bleomycin/antimicrobial peptide transport system ATP-binding/permease protein